MEMLVAVAPGHHAEKPGIVKNNGFNEHTEARVWTGYIANFMGHHGIAIPAGQLRYRLWYLEALKPTFAVEIHFNELKYFAIKFQSERMQSKFIAEKLCESIRHTALVDFQIHPGYYRNDHMYGDEFFLQRSPCPAILLEAPLHAAGDGQLRDGLCCVLAAALVNINIDMFKASALASAPDSRLN